jgi:Mlc titration factor MtfA (ptsG expression regulator)
MAFSWFKKRRRRALLEGPFPDAWRRFLAANVRHYAYLQPRERALLETVVRVVAAEKQWFGGGGFAITEEMKITVAGQAALLVLGLEEPYFFDRLLSIILYPGVYMHPRQLRHYSRPARLLGEAWYHSPIVLSWQDVVRAGRNQSDGHNVVLHEFAHYLDGLDGAIDGTPPLGDREQEAAWYQVTETEYRRLVAQARRDEDTLLDHYGAMNRAEFFAVVTECFFERPQALRRELQDLYRVLHDFYRQDPALWLPDARQASRTEEPEL